MSQPTLFLADIHGNLDALECVLESVRRRGVPPEEADVVCLGDVVGYGPRPNECLDRIEELDAVTVLGNHDAAAVEAIPVTWFNPLARRAIEWTRDQLAPRHRTFLKECPRRRVHGNIECVHGSPSDPLREYITAPMEAKRALVETDPPLIGVGHTHKPALFRDRGGGVHPVSVRAGESVSLDPQSERGVFNPGSVGQPRDGNPDASYLIMEPDDGRLTWHRVSYSIETTQRRIRDAGLPEPLASRLAEGT